MEVKYPDIEVQLSGEDGNVFLIVGKVAKALKKGGQREAADELYKRVTNNEFESYDAVIQHIMTLVEVN